MEIWFRISEIGVKCELINDWYKLNAWLKTTNFLFILSNSFINLKFNILILHSFSLIFSTLVDCHKFYVCAFVGIKMYTRRRPSSAPSNYTECRR